MLLSLRATDITYVPGAMLIIPDLHPIGGERRLNSRLVLHTTIYWDDQELRI